MFFKVIQVKEIFLYLIPQQINPFIKVKFLINNFKINFQYDNLMYSTSPAFSIPSTSRKVFFNPNQNSPGPIYNLFGLTSRQKSQGYRIGASKRSQINHGVQKTPAPTQYNPEKNSKQKKITIPKSKRNNKPHDEMPDPGFYCPQYFEGIIQSRTCLIGGRYSSIMDDFKKTPGPGAYQAVPQFRKTFSKFSTVKKSKSTFNTTAQRFKTIKKSPGPGDYNLPSQNNKYPNEQIQNNKGPKYHVIKQETPGPGKYDHHPSIQKRLVQKLGITISARPEKSLLFSSQSLTANAFAKYDVIGSSNKIKDTILSFKLASSRRKVFQGNQIPSPLDYVTTQYKTKNSFQPTITSSIRRLESENNNPGPGAYSSIGSNKVISFSVPRFKSAQLFRTNNNPGVGRYNMNKKNQKPQINKQNGFSSSSRIDFVSKNKAGVGDYQVLTRTKSAITIPKSGRFGVSKTNPGPGEYEIPSSIGKHYNYPLKNH